MIREAHRGHRIVRLKCGDPFVFGRGGEEALALAAAGVAVRDHPRGIERGRGARCSPAFRSLTAGSRPRSSSSRATPRRPTGRSSAHCAPGSATVVVLMGLGEPARDPATAARRRLGAAHARGDSSRRVAARRRGVARDARHARRRADASQGDLPGIIVVGAVAGACRACSRRARSAEDSIRRRARRVRRYIGTSWQL